MDMQSILQIEKLQKVFPMNNTASFFFEIDRENPLMPMPGM